MSGRAERRPGTLDDSGPAVRRLIDDWEVVGLGIDSPTFKTKEAAEAWMARQIAKLPMRLRPRERNCMACREKFDSDGAHHRLCSDCRKRDGGQVPMGIMRPQRRGDGAVR